MSAPWGDGRDTADERARTHHAVQAPEWGPAPGHGAAPEPARTGGEPETGRTGPEAPRTGLDPVDRVLAREVEISRLPVTERAAAYEELHQELERILSEDPGKLPHGLTAAAEPEAGHPGTRGGTGPGGRTPAHGLSGASGALHGATTTGAVASGPSGAERIDYGQVTPPGPGAPDVWRQR